MSAFQYTIVTPDGDSIGGECESLFVPTGNGVIGILAHHAPLLSELSFGEVRIVNGADTKRYFIENGYVEVLRNKVSLMVERVIEPSRIDKKSVAAEKAELETQQAALTPPIDYEKLNRIKDRIRRCDTMLSLS
ncbi:MAG: ATP synthase F1 subunit epsilon [Spirochaetes bacterium]|nr:ATP synthase F1 subunit epsilon [Spirochaetota bacterium]